jgi:hypothetical protein
MALGDFRSVEIQASDSVAQSDQSFQFNRGVDNNPANRDEYVREQLNK